MIRENHPIHCALVDLSNFRYRWQRAFSILGRRGLRLAFRHVKPSTALILAGALAYTAAAAAGVVKPAPGPDTPTPAAVAPAAGAAPRTRSKIINNREGGFTVTFSKCRENDKHHVSCQFTDPDGDQHWVYLPGVPLPAMK